MGPQAIEGRIQRRFREALRTLKASFPSVLDWLVSSLWWGLIFVFSLMVFGVICESSRQVGGRQLRKMIRALALAGVVALNYWTGLAGWMLRSLASGALEHGLAAVLTLLVGALIAEISISREERRRALQKELRELRRVSGMMRRNLEGRP